MATHIPPNSESFQRVFLRILHHHFICWGNGPTDVASISWLNRWICREAILRHFECLIPTWCFYQQKQSQVCQNTSQQSLDTFFVSDDQLHRYFLGCLLHEGHDCQGDVPSPLVGWLDGWWLICQCAQLYFGTWDSWQDRERNGAKSQSAFQWLGDLTCCYLFINFER